MKTVFVVLVVVTIGSSKPISEADKENYMKIHEDCSKSTGVELESFMLTVEGSNQEADSKAKDHALCVMKKMNIVTDDGKIVNDILTESLTKYLGDSGKANEIITKCSEEKDTPPDTAYYIMSCIHKEKHEN